MAVAHDAVAIPANALYTATFSWTHTPVGTPRGAAVVVVQEGSTDQVSGVTYGGVAMTRVRSDVRTATEDGRVYLYFLGAGVPTGAQTVTVTLTGAEDTNAVSFTVTSAAVDTVVDVSAGLDAGIIANPSLAISPTVAAEIYYGIFSGLAAPVTTVETGSTHVAGKDYGTDSAMWARKSVAAGGATTIGYTAASDDVCHSALAIKEATTYYQTLAALVVGVGVLARVATMYLTLPATATGVAGLTLAKLFSQVLAAVVTGAATLARIPTYAVSLAATITGNATLARASTFYRALVATATGVASLGRVASFYRTLAATVQGAATLATAYIAVRTLSATVQGAATLVRAYVAVRTISATVTGVAGLAAQFIAGGPAICKLAALMVALIEYANPELIPAHLRRVGFITNTTLTCIKSIQPTWIQSEAAAPQGQVVCGAVKYATVDDIPPALHSVGDVA